MNQDLLLQEVLLQAIQRNSELRFESGGNKVIYIKPDSAHGLDKELVEVRGSAKIIYLGGKSPNRFISSKDLRRICLWVDENFKVVKMLCGEEIPHRIEENIKIPSDSQEELEIPPFLRNQFFT